MIISEMCENQHFQYFDFFLSLNKNFAFEVFFYILLNSVYLINNVLNREL